MPQTPEQQRLRYRADIEKTRRQKREYMAKNRDKINARRRELRALNLVKARERDRVRGPRQRHGLRPEDWAAMWVAQDGLCYLCGRPMENLASGSYRVHVDHDHSCCRPNRSCPVCRRGLAHHRCNVAIGLADDDPALLRRMADALEAAQLAFRQRLATSGRNESSDSDGLLF